MSTRARWNQPRASFTAVVVALLVGGATTAATEATRVNAATFPECTICEACDPPHVMANFTAEVGDHASPFFCGFGVCNSNCSFTLAAPVKAMVIEAASEGLSAQLYRLMKKYPEHIRLHVARSAIQIVGCYGRVEAHIPVLDETVGELLAHR